MHRLTVCYGHPNDTAVFGAHYREVHRPLAEKLPGLRGLALRACESVDGEGHAPYHLVAELAFDGPGELATALASPEGQAGAADLENFATGGVTLFVQRDLP
jgi:uncharacterized protein (TIGR02118 family)